MRFKTPGHGTAIAYVALFIALSGTAVAATGGVGSSSTGKSRPATMPTRVVTVSATSTSTANGTALRKALHGLSVSPHPLRQRELLVGPGMYDVGMHSIALPAHVTVVGSGEGATTIRSEFAGLTAAIGGASVRDLTVMVNAAAGDARAALGGGALDLRNLNLVAHAPNGRAYGIHAVGAITAENVTVRTTGGDQSAGVYTASDGATIVFRNGSIVATDGFAAAGGCDSCSILIVSSLMSPSTTVPTATCIGDYTPQSSVDAYYATIPDGPCPS